MRIYRGKTRLVIIISGLAIKFAKIQVWLFLKTYLKHIFTEGIIKAIKELMVDLWKNEWDCEDTYSQMLMAGVAANKIEAYYYGQNKQYRLLIPTIFSFLGLINIQRAGQPLPNSNKLIRDWLEQQLGKDITAKDPYFYELNDSFCFYRGQLCICDYAHIKAVSGLLEHSDKLQENFRLEDFV